MYASFDGRNHQANLTMAVRESDMTVTDSAHEVANPGSNYVSHSFNQFILVDHEQRIVALDHGNAYPRSAVLSVFPAKAGNENITNGEAREATIQSFPGATGSNTTGASFGGLAETAGGYAVAYNYDGAGKSDSFADHSVYFAYVDKNSLGVKTKAISGAGTSTPVLAPTGLNGGYILWNGIGDDSAALYYAAYSNGGSVGEVKTATARLSDCQPILYNGKAVWYTTNGSMPIFYQLDESGVAAVKARLTLDADPFTDVSDGDYFSQSVIWAVENGITTGTGDGTTFSPDQICTRAEIVTFLYRFLA